MKNVLSFFLKPFEKIAGIQALIWGLLGLIVSVFISYYSGFHYNGLLQYGPASNNALWVYVAEHFIVWLVPAIIFCIGGIVSSKSQIRFVDVFGTVIFAQLPFILMNLFNLLPPMQRLLHIDMNLSPMEMMKDPGFLVSISFSVFCLVFVIWILIWMFNALKVSCNLKGKFLWIWYAAGIIVGDIFCRIIISYLR